MIQLLLDNPLLLLFVVAALEQSGDELPNVGYSAVYPVALITKILFAQLLVALLA